MSNVNEMFKEVQAMQTRMTELSSEFLEMEGEKIEHYSNPFNQKTPVRETVQKIRSELIAYYTFLYQKALCPNVPIDPDDVTKIMNEHDSQDFNVSVIRAYISKKAEDAPFLSLNEIRATARRMLPPVWSQGDETIHTDETIRKGVVLALHKYVTKLSGGHCYLSTTDDIQNLEKLIWVVCIGASPVTVTSGQIFKLDRDNLFGVKTPVVQQEADAGHTSFESESCPVEKYQLYKNGNFKLTFYDEQDAETVLKVLLQPINGDDDD